MNTFRIFYLRTIFIIIYFQNKFSNARFLVKLVNPENYLEEFGKMSRTKNKNKVNDTKSNSTAKENEQSSQGDDDSKGKYVKANRPLLQLNKGNLNNYPVLTQEIKLMF